MACVRHFVENLIFKCFGKRHNGLNLSYTTKRRIKNKQKIRVCFSVVFDSVFPAESIFKQMQTDDFFEPFILVIPDTLRGEENMFYQLEKTYKTLSAKYKNVYMSYDYDAQDFIDWHDKMDMCFFANPYDYMTHKFYRVKYLKSIVPCLHIPYSYTGCFKYNCSIYKEHTYSMFTYVFVENQNNYKLIQQNQNSKVNNLYISGYPKMDALFQCKRIRNSDRPQIIISPHHTVKQWENGLNLSQFLRFADFYLTLPNKYPNIDFIFRPHPLLFVTLSQDDLWGKDKVQDYIDKISSFPNVTYQDSGDYFQTFVDSDAIINDSGSFLMESFYVPMPQCFLLKDAQQVDTEFTDFGKNVLNYVYTAFTAEDIEMFIQNVVLNKNDTMKDLRNKFAGKHVTINYPDATNSIIKMLKRTLKRAAK